MRPSNRSRPADSRKIWGQTGFAQNYRKLNEPPQPRLQRNGTIYLMARPPLLCQGGDFAFPAGCPRRPCPADDLWVTLNLSRLPSLTKEGSWLLSTFSPTPQRNAFIAAAAVQSRMRVGHTPR